MKTTSPPIPARLATRPVWQGYVIPFSTFVRPDGTPDFRVTDQEHWQECAILKRCGICGDTLQSGEPMFFIGGEKSMESGLFFDPPMHEECARYSFAVCPFLSGKKGYAPNLPKVEGATLHIDTTISTERPKRMGMLKADSFRLVQQGDNIYFLANKLSVEWFDL